MTQTTTSVARPKKPEWLKVKLPSGDKYNFIKSQRKNLGLATVCEEANCPNIGECWSTGTATFMILGDTCTRGCRFCSVKTSRRPAPPDPNEPEKLGDTISQLALDYVVLTTVDRDDMPDQGAGHIARCITGVQSACPSLLIEILMPDFRGDHALVDIVVDSAPAVLAHNVETVERLTGRVRDKRAGYRQSLDVLARFKARNPLSYTKSSLMVGLGETAEEIEQAMKDMRSVGVDFLTIGQYLQPNRGLLDVFEFIHPDKFMEYERLGLSLGFRYVASGPLVRSSYKAAEHFIKSILTRQTQN